MLKRAVPKPPRVFILKSKYGALPAGRVVEVEPVRVQVVQPRAGRVRMQAAGPRAS